MIGARIRPELVEELCWSRDERNTRTRAAERVLTRRCARRVTACTRFEAMSADWLLAPDLAKEEGKQDSSAPMLSGSWSSQE